MVRKNTSGHKPKRVTNRLASNGKKASQIRKNRGGSHASTNPERPLPDSKQAGFYRDASKIKLLNMYNEKPDAAKMHEHPLAPVRIQPDRRWFGNTRVITQTKLQQFRDAMENARKDPYFVVLKRSKLPVALFSPEPETKKEARVDLLSLEPFNTTFGKQLQRKRPKLTYDSLSAFADKVVQEHADYDETTDGSMIREELETRDAASEEIFKKGTSRRIWQELYKVIDSSDVLVYVVDARDPMGTRCLSLESYIKKDKPNKHVVLLLNKCDLVPAWCTSRWVKVLSSQYPTVAFHSSLTNPFGKLALINLLRQYAGLLKDRKHVSVGFIGYPNVGKSSVINTLRSKRVCRAAPVPGETKIWQYVALTHRVYLIDCPGIVSSDACAEESDTAKVLKGTVRAERLMAPEQHIGEVLERVDAKNLIQRYHLDQNTTWDDAEQFLAILARRMGKLLKGGEPDISITARIVLYDWQRGRIPFFVPPPFFNSSVASAEPANDVALDGLEQDLQQHLVSATQKDTSDQTALDGTLLSKATTPEVQEAF